MSIEDKSDRKDITGNINNLQRVIDTVLCVRGHYPEIAKTCDALNMAMRGLESMKARANERIKSEET